MSELELSFCLSCEPGFVGSSCELATDVGGDCKGAACDSNQVCVVEIPNTCDPGYTGPKCTTPIIPTNACDPGYTGPKCATVINTCFNDGLNCSGNGECIDLGGAGMLCECLPSFTGRFCESQVHGYELWVTVNSYSNPTNTCAACRDKSSQCCDSDCSAGCDVYFILCTRPYSSPLPANTSSYGGACPLKSIQTKPDTDSSGSVFTNFVLGIPNPISLRNIPNVSVYSSD